MEGEVSLGYTHAVVTALVQNGYLLRSESNNRITLVDPMRVVRRWASYHQYATMNTFVDYYSFEREIETLLDRFKRIEPDKYALTGLSGAWLVAPQVRPIAVECYVRSKDDISAVATTKLELKSIPKEGNVRFVVPYDQGVFYKARSISTLRVVSDIQLYVDLYNYPARGEEAAEAILPRIEKAWGDAMIKGGVTSV